MASIANCYKLPEGNHVLVSQYTLIHSDFLFPLNGWFYDALLQRHYCCLCHHWVYKVVPPRHKLVHINPYYISYIMYIYIFIYYSYYIYVCALFTYIYIYTLWWCIYRKLRNSRPTLIFSKRVAVFTRMPSTSSRWERGELRVLGDGRWPFKDLDRNGAMVGFSGFIFNN